MKYAASFVTSMLVLLASGVVWANENEGVLTPGDSNTAGNAWNRAMASDTMGIGIKGRLWIADMENDLRIDEDAVAGTTIDVDSVLDVDPSDEIPELEIYFHLSDSSRINFHYWTVQFEGDKALAETITYAGSTYTLGTTVETDMEINTYTITYERLFPFPDATGFTLGAQIGVKFIDFSGSLEAVDAIVPFEEDEDFQAPIPVLGVRCQIVASEWLTLEAQVNGLFLSNIRDVDATMYDAVLEADVTLWEGLYGGVGYHIFHIDVEDDSHSDEEIEIDMTIDGFFFAVGYRF